MRYGAQLQNSRYKPWADSYIDYPKLKKLLREKDSEEDGDEWTDDDENRFTEELLNTQLEKVNTFQSETYQNLRQRTTECENRLGKVADDGKEKFATLREEVIEELDDITKKINELEKYSRVNFTGFLKAAKKHDRRRGAKYKIRPLLQVRLAALPFNSEDYSPLLYEISTMYAFAQGTAEAEEGASKPRSESKSEGDKYSSYKFWVHEDNLVEAKTYILRRLPVLVYNPQASKTVESGGSDPTLTSLYFDNSNFSLYNDKIGKTGQVSSLRLRWFGQLNSKPEVFFEKKTIGEDGESEEVRVPIKEKYVQPFLSGEYRLNKDIEKLKEREGASGDGAAKLQHNVDEIQSFLQENDLQPMLRANYTRTAFQIPGDSRVRVSIDTDLAFIREDSLDKERPCRSPNAWHRTDVDTLDLKFPFSTISEGEVARFPYAVLEIKIKKGVSKRTMKWVDELMSSHLVKEAPKFSKFVHGVAQLFDDHVNSLPFWLGDLETDIRQDPQDAYREEQEKKAAQVANEQAVEGFLGSTPQQSNGLVVGSPASQHLSDKHGEPAPTIKPAKPEDSPAAARGGDTAPSGRGISSLFSFTTLSNTKYARAHRRGQVTLPPGVTKPKVWIKDNFTASVEPKVWLANERTFVKWQHVGILLASLSLALFNSAGSSNTIARTLAVIYTLFAVFAFGWGWWMYIERCRMIKARSGKDFDNPLGPIIVCIGLTIALVTNFGLKVRRRLLAAVLYIDYCDPV